MEIGTIFINIVETIISKQNSDKQNTIIRSDTNIRSSHEFNTRSYAFLLKARGEENLEYKKPSTRV